MKFLQLLILIEILICTQHSKAGWETNPYLGYGQLSLQLGDEVLVNGQAASYVLGVKSGWSLGQNFLIALDYSRSGPFELGFKHRYYGTSIDSGLFTLFSGGLGLEYNIGSWTFWYGSYPYHTLEEQRIDFQMKGTMTRLGIGIDLDSKTTVHFNYETSKLSLKDPSYTVRSIICYNSSIQECTTTGQSMTLFFAISAKIN